MLAVAIKTVIFSLGLALVVIAALVVYFGLTFGYEDFNFGFTTFWRFFVLAWPASIPLALAVVLLHRRSRLAAWLCVAVLAPLLIICFILALLMQTIIFFIAAALSLPVYLALLTAKLRQGRGLPAPAR
jgi:hypothetical protein